MKKINLLKTSLLIMVIFGLMFSSLSAQHLFSVSQNDLSKESVALLKNQTTRSEISTLSLTKNNENKNVYSVALSSAQDAKIIVLNEQTGNHVVVTPAEKSLTEFQLAPFFIEELRQGALGNATRFLVIETTSDFSVKNVASISATDRDVFVPQYFYGTKENVKEALPKDRQIVHIFKQKPQLLLANPDDFEMQRFAAQWEEERCYYLYMFKLPDGTLCTYDEHFNPDNSQNATRVGEYLQFDLTSINMDETKITATEHALELWSEKLSGAIPIDLSVEFKYLGGGGTIGQSFHMQTFLNTGQVPGSPTNTWYPASLWNQLVGYDATTGRDIKLEMNTNFNFYFGVTGNPGYSQIDWITTMLHEVAHGLGFAPSCGQDGQFFAVTSPNGGYGIDTDYPGIFDLQLFQGTSGDCISELTVAQRQSLMVSGNLYAGAPGSNLLAANGGSRVKMYAPNPYQGGSSNSHWDSNVSFSTFMKYYINQGWKLHTIGTRKIGMLLDLGWVEPIIEPNASWVTFEANGGAGNMSKQQFLPDEAQNLRENSFTKEGYTFTGWNTLENGAGTSYTNQQSITLSNDMTLYAQWEANNYTLALNPNGGTVNPNSVPVTYDALVGELPIPVRARYRFEEWRIAATPITEETIWNYAQNMTATARWTLVTHTITASATDGGSISPSGSVSVTEGTDRTFTITPGEESVLLDVLVDEESVGAVNEYTFENVEMPHTIHAIFSGLGVAETQNLALVQIVPNPANHTIELRITNYELRVDKIEFYNIFGQLVKSVPCAGEISKDVTTQRINISDLSAGVYVVKTGEKAVKLVVN